MAGSEGERSLWGWEQFFGQLETFLRDADRQIETSSPQFAEYAVERFGVAIQALSSIVAPLEGQEDEDLIRLRSSLEEVRTSCRLLKNIWQSVIDEVDTNAGAVGEEELFEVPRVIAGRGRPRALITREQLEYLRSMNFSWGHVAELLGVSRLTIYRRRRALGMQDEDILRPMDADELHRFVSQMREEFPSIGESLLIGRLYSMGYHVARERVRAVIRATDPINTALRWRGILTSRRPYSIAGPNSLWHVGKCVV